MLVGGVAFVCLEAEGGEAEGKEAEGRQRDHFTT